MLTPKTAIIGSGGGGKSSGPAVGASEIPNSLISNAVAKVIDLIGEGEIGGLVNGGRSVYLDGTPLEGEDGTGNFEGIDYSLLTGTPDKDSLPQFDCLEGEVVVEV